MKRIFDPTFRYVRSEQTDIKKTFARERRRLKALAERDQANQAEASAKTSQLRPKKRA